MKEIIYISHPSGGKKENFDDAQKCLDILLSSDEIHNNYCVVSPIQCYGGMYKSTDYNRGLQYCIDLLEHCSLMVVIGDYNSSTGCKAEIEYCKNNNISMLFYKTSDELKNNIREIMNYNSRN